MTPELRLFRNLPEPIDRFQVMGERCSGIGWAAELIRCNLPELHESKELGWQHGFFDRRLAASPGLLTIVIYRHPIRWLQSVHQTLDELSRTMHGLSFGDFIRATWEPAWSKHDAHGLLSEEPIQGDMVPHTTVRFANALRLRAGKTAYLEELAKLPCQVAYIRIEELNRAPGSLLAALARGVGLSPLMRLKPGARQPPSRPSPPLLAADRAFIDHGLDTGLEHQIGYEPWTFPQRDGLPWFAPRAF